MNGEGTATGENSTDIVDRLVTLLNAQRLADLERLASTHLTHHPVDGYVWKILGVCLKLQSKDALHALQTAASLLPADAEAQSNLAIALADSGCIDQAVECFQQALLLAPGAAHLHEKLGRALHRLGKADRAMASLRQAILLKPDFVEAHNYLGTVLRESGYFEEAAASYKRALQFQPRATPILGNLANTLVILGRIDEAIGYYRIALEVEPEFAEMLYYLAVAQAESGKLDEAVASLRGAIRLKADFADAHDSLGSVLRDLGMLEEAAASCRRALAIKPDFVAAHVNLATILRLQNRPADAETCCRNALLIDADSAPAIACLANIKAETGQFSAAEELYRRAVAVRPDFAEAWASIPGLRKMTQSDATWLQTAREIAALRLTSKQAAYLHFGIGKYCDDIKDFDLAFAHYRQAHQSTVRYGRKFDRELLASSVDYLIDNVGAAWISKVRSNANPSTRPVFIIGMPRSGTSLAEQILAAHPDCFGAGELMYWRSVCAPHAMPAMMGDHGDEVLRRLAGDYLALLHSHSPGAARVVDKMPGNFMFAGMMSAAFPNARFIHMRRHPVDTCLSIYFQHFDTPHSYADSLDDLAYFYNQYLRLMAHWHRALPPGTILDVPYESLVADQESWSRKMLTWIGLPWDARCLDFHMNQRGVSTASKWQVKQTINKNSVERWRNYEKYLGPLSALIAPESP